MSARCYLCGSAEGLSEPHPHNWLCTECLPASEHVVHMSNPGGKSLAACDCGWRSEVEWGHRAVVQEAKVRLHWRDAIKRALEDFDALHGEGTAVRELAVGLVAGLALFVNVVGWLAIAGGGHG